RRRTWLGTSRGRRRPWLGTSLPRAVRPFGDASPGHPNTPETRVARLTSRRGTPGAGIISL
ncbi:hypothetical protein, partial [Georgenia sp.]